MRGQGLILAFGWDMSLAYAGDNRLQSSWLTKPHRHAPNNLSRLWPVVMRRHSLRTFSLPLSKNCRKLLACLIWPKTGSDSAFLIP